MKKHLTSRPVCLAFALLLAAALLLSACQKKDADEAAKGSELAGVYQTKIEMSETQSVTLYLNVASDGSFVFARDTSFSSDEKGAGTIGTAEDGKDAFLYTVVNGQSVEDGSRIATFEVTADGGIQFTSPMWFGSTEPKYLADDGTATYPLFVPFDAAEAQVIEAAVTEASSAEETAPETSAEPEETTTAPTTTATTAAPTTTKAPTTTAAPTTTTAAPTTTKAPVAVAKPTTTKAPVTTTKPATTKPVTTTAPASLLKEGTYKGSTSRFVDAMNSNVRYDVTLVMRSGAYDYTVKITLTGEMEHTATEHYTGAYTVNGDRISMTGKLSGGTIYGSSIAVTGLLSSFASSESTVTVFQ